MAAANGVREPLLRPKPAEGDESTTEATPPVPDYRGRSSFLSFLFFTFAYPLLKLGNSRQLQLQDLPPPPAGCESEKLLADFLRAWHSTTSHGRRRRRRQQQPSIKWALWKLLWADIVRTAVLALVKGVGVLSGPIFLYFFVRYASSSAAASRHHLSHGLLLVLSLAFIKMVENFGQRHWYSGTRVLGSKMQSSLIAAIYHKQLRLSSSARRRHSSGEIINYVSVDAFRLCEFAWRLHWSWLVFFIVAGSLCISASVVGFLPTLPAAILIVLVFFSLTPLMASMQASQRSFMAAQDERLRRTTEVLQGIKVIKLQAWEEKFDEFIRQKREAEFRHLRSTQTKRNYATVIYWLMPTVLTSVVLLSAILIGSGSRLTSTVVFTVLATFRIIQDPVRMAPEVLASVIQAQISIARLEKFLQEEELSEEEEETAGMSEYLIRVDGASWGWRYPEDPTATLAEIGMVVKRGEKVAVCGAVGSGKSSLLLALLKEMPKISGSVSLSGASVAYVPQSAWIQSMSVRDNILFGKPFDGARYRRALKAAALDDDLRSFSHGDLTEIGERGVNMSGGQKQRIQLARAVYHDADLYLLDDPFSAVDAQTASVLFHDCVMGELKDKTVILVTHQIEFLPSVDTILVMQGGRIKQAGSYDDLLGGDVFQELVAAHEQGLQAVREEGGGGAAAAAAENGGDGGSAVGIDVEKRLEAIQKTLSREQSLTEVGIEQQKQEQVTQLVEEEAVAVGTMGWKPYLTYVRIGRAYGFAIAILVLQLLFSGAQLYGNLWLAEGVSDSGVSSELLVAVYAAISVVCVLAFLLRSQIIVKLGLRASRSFFNKLMTCVMKAPMSFFDSTPSGRILQRASTDMSVIDLDLPFALSSALGSALDVVCVVVVTCIVTWQIIVVIVPVLAIARYLQVYYAAVGHQLSRINSVTKAPIVNSAAEAMSGSATIRAFRQVERFRRRNLELIDRDSSAYIYKFATIEWMVLRLEFSSSVVLITIASLVLFNGSISGGFVGLAVTYALALNSSLVVFSIWWSFLDIFIVSAERIKQYLDLPSEAPAVIESERPPKEWPTEGEVRFQNLKIRYRKNSALVLKGISCRIEGGKKVGVVGRTGSGKTTLMSALFRLVEPSDGSILIDGVDICRIGLHDLRMKLGVIPQEPVLFQGTVRTNLDPLNQYSDHHLWEALKKCQLSDVIQHLPLRLDSAVSDQGENWSAGQRQLFCMGRVLLKRSKVLVMDEATASIDSATDAVIQRVIREEFGDCTVITVAHRIPTVVDSDMVLALKDGKAIEFDSPKRLMEEKTTLFAQLVAEYWAQSNRHSRSNLNIDQLDQN